MSRIRFSMTSAMLAIAFIALSLAGLRHEGTSWTRLLFMGVFFTMIVSILFAVYRKGDRRAFWLGFALVGWGFLLFTYVLPNVSMVGDMSSLANGFALRLQPRLGSQVAMTVPTTTSAFGSGSMGMMSGTSGLGMIGTVWMGPTFEQVLTVCNAWLTILFALAGGFVARHIAGQDRRTTGSHGTSEV
jgi:hypothetical protein